MSIKIATLLVISLVLSSTFLEFANAQATSPASSPAQSPSAYCGEKCGERCSKAGNESRCMRYCLMCCDKCRCVPSGTYGNKDECPCYRDWTSPNGRPKWP